MDNLYKKRFGTSGISGQLYETKLISLIFFRLLNNDRVEDFYLASNMDEVGSFDDICLKIKIRGHDRPIVAFIQVKHRDNDDKFLTLDNKNDAVKWSDSILKIKKKITSSKNNDKMFSGDIEFVFILYTNANCDLDSHSEFNSDYASPLNSLIATSTTVGSRPLYTEQDIQEFGEIILKEDIALLVERFAKFLSDKTNQSMNILNDEYILRYHFILARNVVNVSKVKNEEQSPELKWRTITFRNEFLDHSDDEYLTLFRNLLYEQLLRNQLKLRRQTSGTEKKPGLERLMSEPDDIVQKRISKFLSEPTAETLSPLIENYITCNKLGKLEFLTDRPVNYVKQLAQVNISQVTIEEAKEIAAKTKLASLKLKVPVAFGNIDLTISGNLQKIERRLQHLTDVIIGLCQKSSSESHFKIVTIDDTLDSGLLSTSGGLATAVGNILVYDEHTKLVKFVDDHTILCQNAESLYLKLKNKLEYLHDYRFDIKTMKFPKLSFDCTSISREFLSKLIIYTKQSNHYEVEEILKKEIQQHFDTDLRNYSVKADNVFLYYHNVIQKWWMSPKSGPYLTKTSDIFVQAINNTVGEPQISALQNMFYMSNIKYFSYSFTENAVESFKSLDVFSTVVIVTDIPTLTTIKVVQCLKDNYINNKYAVLDFECVINLPTINFCALDAELRNTEKVIIMVFNNSVINAALFIRLQELSHAMKGKQLILITNKSLLETVKAYFPNADVVNDEAQSLLALTSESQRDIVRHVKVIFQGKEISLELLVDDVCIASIKGDVLNKIIRNETISLGTSLSNTNYEEIKELYIDRRVSQSTEDDYDDIDYDNIRHVKTFHDIDDDAVLITAAPGMGKSTLLTHLSLKSKEQDEKLWIVRINLLDYSKEFYKWQENGTAINTLELIKFMCHIVLKNNDIKICLEEADEKLYINNFIYDEWALFELNMFLHFYNQRKLIILFDGFDEICPHYKDNVIHFFEIVRNFPQKNKMWVTSRPYSDILPDLHKALGKSFRLEHLSDTEQAVYLKNIWRRKLVFHKLNNVQLRNVITYMNFITKIMSLMYAPDALNFRFRKIYYILFDYIYFHFPHVTKPIGFAFYDHNNVRQYVSVLNSTETKFNSEEPNSTFADTEVDPLLGTPLLLYFIAEYFVHMIDTSESVTKWKLGVNILTIYDMFIESKLKKILFQDKNKMDVYNPDIMSKFEKERADCVAMHKKIAAYVLLGSPIFGGLNLDELKEMDPLHDGGLIEFETIIHAIKTGREKTGLISHVTADEVPVFIHRTFTEYFAAQFICDVLKSSKYEFQKKKLLFVTTYICHKNDVFPWISKKKEIDKSLAHIIIQIEDNNPLVLTWYSTFLSNANLPLEQYIRIMSSSKEDYYEGDYLNKYEKEDHTKKIQNMISKMKPHLKKYFAPLCTSKHKSWLHQAVDYNE